MLNKHDAMREIVFVTLFLLMLCPGRGVTTTEEIAAPVIALWEPLGPDAPTVLRMVPHRGVEGIYFAITKYKLFRTSDSGLTWSPLPIRNGVDVAIHNASSTVYGLSSHSRSSSVLLRSTDHGKTFPVRTPVNNELRRIFVDPLNKDHLFASARIPAGLLESHDAGNTWTEKRKLPIKIGDSVSAECVADQYFFFDLLMLPDSKTIYASGDLSTDNPDCQSSSCHCDDLNFLYFSKNGGKSWETIDLYNYSGDSYSFLWEPKYPKLLLAYNADKGIVGLDNGAVQQITEKETWQLAVDLKNENLFYSVEEWGRQQQRLYVSNDRANSWLNRLNKTSLTTYDLVSATQGSFFSATGAGIYLFDRNRWISRNSGLRLSDVFSVSVSRDGDSLYSIVDGSIFESIDSGHTWENLTAAEKFPQLPFRHVAVNPRDKSHIVAFAGRNIFVTQTAGEHWESYKAGFHQSIFDFWNPNVVYFTQTDRIFRSTKHGLHPELVFTDPGPPAWDEGPLRVVSDEFHKDFVFAYHGNRIFRSANRGTTFQQFKVHPSENAVVHSVIHFPGSEKLLASLEDLNDDSGIYLSKDHGMTWTRISPFWGTVIGGIPPVLYATSFGYTGSTDFYKSTDGGQTWSSAVNDLPDSNIGIYSITSNRSGVYLVTDHGLLKSLL